MAWTNMCSQSFYKRYVRQNKERFEEQTIKQARVLEQQKLLDEFPQRKEAFS